MAKILIIDDDRMLCEMVCTKLRMMNHEAAYALTLAEGKKTVYRTYFDLVMLDVRLPDGSGLEELAQIKSANSKPEVIIITGEGDPDGAEMAIQTGAWDYIEKPLSIREITLQVTRALEYRAEKKSRRPVTLLKKEGILGDDPKIEACLERVAKSAVTDMPVLITGKTGTGKEIFARAVHANSERTSGPFVVLDCAAFPEKLIDSMLFGHSKGAFTGAIKEREGLILQADKGTLFMDEVGELPLSVQKTFLRVLQEHQFRPVGSKRELASDFRLVAATNRNLELMVQEGSFRKDLLFRLKAATIHLPSLKERPGDIEELSIHYISSFCKRYGMVMKGISEDFMKFLQDYAWPGNVRELINVIDVAVANAQGYDVLVPRHLPADIRISIKRQTMRKHADAWSPALESSKEPLPSTSLKESLEKVEKRYLQALIAGVGKDIKAACRVSGLSRSGLYARLKKYHIKRLS